jgi:hypothetical protein
MPIKFQFRAKIFREQIAVLPCLYIFHHDPLWNGFSLELSWLCFGVGVRIYIKEK